MTITEQFKAKRCVFSIECFPPRQTTQMDKLKATLQQMQTLNPGFISVTFGAGGSAGGVSTAEVADYIQNELQIPTLAHLICMGNDQIRAAEILDQLEAVGVRDVLALRGDRTARGKGVASVPSPVANIAELLHSDETTEAFLERFGALLLQYYGLSGYSPISPNETERIAQIERIRRMKQQADNHGE